MVQRGKWSKILISLCLLLSSCATKHVDPNFQTGQTAFDSGDYPQAFHLLLPIASDGNAKAQYAVGYIYYNGYGVTPDKESGLFWIQESAKQNYAPAVKALDDILQQVVNETPPSAATTADATTSTSTQPIATADATSAMTPTPLPEPVVATQVSQSDAVLQSIKSDDKSEQKITVDNTLPKEVTQKHYTLQVFGDYSLDTVKAMQVKLHVKNQSHIFHTEHNNKDWYVLTYGSYDSIADALLAENTLSSSLSQLHPWVRKVDKLSQIG